MKPAVDNYSLSPTAPAVNTTRHDRRRKIRTGLALRSLIRMREPTASIDGEMPVNSIPSKDTPVDRALVANGCQLALTSLTSIMTPPRPLERRTFEIAKPKQKEKQYASQVFTASEQPRKPKLKSEIRLSSMNIRTQSETKGILRSPETKKRPEEAKLTVRTRQQVIALARKEASVSWVDAIRDKEWVVKAKEQINKDTTDKLARGNGVVVQEGGNYRYFLGKGNNSKLVKNIMQSRWWWTRTPNVEEANLVWTQSRDLEWLQKAERAQGEWTVASDEGGVACKVKFIPDKSMKSYAVPVDISPLKLDDLFSPESYQAGEPVDWTGLRIRTHNKLEHTYHLSNKKALYINLKNYCEATGQSLFEKVPLTFHIQHGVLDPEFQAFVEAYQVQAAESKLFWIVKPGENSNRGTGITVCNTVDQVREELKQTVCEKTGKAHTYIVQQYIDKPYLINKRKFDIRLYAVITSINGVMQGYYYNEGYLRTSSKEFTLSSLNRMIHLTNDAVQKKGDDYGRFESGNKISYNEFQRYLEANYGQPVSFFNDVLPKIIGLVKDAIMATFRKLDPEPKQHTFEVYGFDFMLDVDLKPWLIEVNTNPCLELSAPNLARIIPAMLDNAFRVALDPYFPEPKTHSRRGSHYNDLIHRNNFLLIFNSKTDGLKLIEKTREAGTEALLTTVDPALGELSKDDDECEEDVAPA